MVIEFLKILAVLLHALMLSYHAYRQIPFVSCVVTVAAGLFVTVHMVDVCARTVISCLHNRRDSHLLSAFSQSMPFRFS